MQDTRFRKNYFNKNQLARWKLMNLNYELGSCLQLLSCA